ncbi:PCI domain-containing protein 2 [Wickerhamomyces ciferrii]|uniref:PCI domain-containing protein 2 n=1 Tax=Wickerhamomyces ciferrii (strain ATCC 14091 / BCRC 22168 / CBS 111 / JCM 3599 / NBRC 0793 / NRRL Y-1031 F-60-10) TaxID=1206466 RepID=K0KN12_WICCF|nr:PCI domain-containing protein 2 [Wickerhamomyces ciferrii]CCH46655.1 PCI domain-containing protein 2 [Wickerhamomyces ciferrii]
MSLDHFLNEVRSASVNSIGRDGSEQFANLLSVNLTTHQTAVRVSTLQKELQANQSLDLDKLVESQNYYDNDWLPFNSIVVSYLKFCRDINPRSILQSHDLLLYFYNDLSIAFLNNTYGNHMSKLMFETTKYLVPMMKRVDFFLNLQNNGKKFKRLIFVSTILTKVFNHLRSLKGQSNKKQLILFIVNNLNKVYFTINNPLLCANIFANMNLLNLKLSQYPKAQQIEYRYILGKYYMIKNQFTKAFHHLQWSYMKSSKIANEKNTLRILRLLIPVSLLTGRIPSKQALSISPEFQQHYYPLIKYLLTGNHIGFQKYLFDNQEYFKNKLLLIPLAQRSKILIFRNLLFNIMMWTQSTRFSYDQIGTTLRLSIGSPQQQSQLFGDQYLFQIINEPIDDSFIENVCVSLNENGMIKGNVLSRARTLVCSKKEPFTNIPAVYDRLFGPSSNEKWMDL